MIDNAQSARRRRQTHAAPKLNSHASWGGLWVHPLAQFLEQHQQGQADTLKTNTRGTIGWPNTPESLAATWLA
jgi:hypothetical protein